MLAASFLDKMLWKNSMSLISTSNYITIELLEIWHDRWNIFTPLGIDRCLLTFGINLPVNIYLYKNKNTRKRSKISSKLTINTAERRNWRRSGVFIVNFEYISHLFLVFLLLTLNKQLLLGYVIQNTIRNHFLIFRSRAFQTDRLAKFWQEIQDNLMYHFVFLDRMDCSWPNSRILPEKESIIKQNQMYSFH